MKIYRKIVIGVVVVLSIALAIFMFVTHPIFGSNPTDKDFKKFEEYSLTLAQTFDLNSITDEDVSAEYHVEEEGFIVKIKSIKYCYVVESVYPISEIKLDAEKAEIKQTIQYENVKHYHYFNWGDTNVESKRIAIIFVFIISLGIALIFGVCAFGFFYGIPKCISMFIIGIITIYRLIKTFVKFK